MSYTYEHTEKYKNNKEFRENKEKEKLIKDIIVISEKLDELNHKRENFTKYGWKEFLIAFVINYFILKAKASGAEYFYLDKYENYARIVSALIYGLDSNWYKKPLLDRARVCKYIKKKLTKYPEFSLHIEKPEEYIKRHNNKFHKGAFKFRRILYVLKPKLNKGLDFLKHKLNLRVFRTQTYIDSVFNFNISDLSISEDRITNLDFLD